MNNRKIALVLALAAVGCAHSQAGRSGAVVWDAQAAAEATQVMHRLHEAWNKMDMATVEKYVAEDGFLTTFEIGNKSNAVQLKTRDQLLAFLRDGFAEFQKSGSTTEATPVVEMECRATRDMAVCTEECDIAVRLADGLREVIPHRGTSVLRKGPDGWKFTHWHISEKGARYVLDQHGNRVASASTPTP
jgi:ketosteroid isomerase-like protein